ncbi:MAG: AMP-binding protein [Desulfobacterales bacterium]|nr:AMP-binding protein [Desulfobacterales bacterium]
MLTGKTYAQIYDQFSWHIPEFYNVGVDVCDKWADKKDRLALIYLAPGGKEQRYSFRDLKTRSNQLANALRAHGIEKGDRVGILLPQCPETLISHIAIYKLGGIALPLLTLFGSLAIEYRLDNSAAKAVITDSANLAKILEIKERLPALMLILVVDSAGLPGILDFWECVQKGRPHFKPVQTRADDPALIIYTSGTTGPPKGTLHAHRILLGILPGFEFYHNLFPQKGDLVWTPLDWAYIGGSYDTLFPTLHHGYPVLAFRARKFDPDEAFSLMAKYGVRNMMAVPTVLRLMMHAVENPREKYDLRLRSITAGGETLGAELYQWSRRALGVELNEQYGQTECDYVIGFCSEVMEVVPGAIGKAVPGHQVDILTANGDVAKAGELGEIAVRCPDPVMFLEYWGDPQATRKKFSGEWMRTGDYGVRDENGHFWFTGRQDELIESGGYRIGPGEVEDCLMKHAAVKLVGVIGVPDDIRGEIVKAYIVLKKGFEPDTVLQESIQQHVKSQLEAHAYPREVEFIRQMPMTKTGKILKNELRKMHTKKKI